MRFSGRRSVFLVSLGVVLLLAACGGGNNKSKSGEDRNSKTPKIVAAFAGLNDPKDTTIAVLAFMPQRIKVTTGAQLTWTFTGPEPHTVTFLATGQPTPSPESPDATKVIGSPGPFDGTSTVNSGLQPTSGTPFKFALTFTKAGTYNYVCTIHPGMVGTVEVVSGAAESLNEIGARARKERDAHLAEGRAAKTKFMNTSPSTKKNSDGSTTYTVEMGVSTAHTAILAFQPLKADIKAGDKVVFLNNSGLPHTASFAGSKTLPSNPDSPEAKKAAPGKSPQTLNATDFFNTGWLPPNAPPGGAPPLAARSFTFNVPSAGTYAYVCLLHQSSKHVGSIVAT